MSHNLGNNIQVLRRWQAHGGGALPADWTTFEKANILAAVSIKERDPELVALLDGSADAGLVADALSGKFAPTPPDLAKQQKQDSVNRMNELLAKLEAGEANLQERVELEERAPEEFQKVMSKVGPTPEQIAAAKAQKAAATQQMRDVSKRKAHAEMMNTARAEGRWG